MDNRHRHQLDFLNFDRFLKMKSMFNAISNNVNKLHRAALYRAINDENAKWNSANVGQRVTVIVGTKNILRNLIKAIFSNDSILLYFSGFGRLYTDFGIFGRLTFAAVVAVSSLRSARHFIVENKHDYHVISRLTKRDVTQINGSGFDKSYYRAPCTRLKRTSFKVVGYMSRFGKSKCTDEVIKLIATLPSEYKIMIAGKDISGTKYTKKFYQLAQTNPQLEMIGYLETPEEVSSFFRKIDVLLYPSMREGLPITLLESIFHNVPFLTTTVAGCDDLATRFNFPTCRPEDFGKRLNHLAVPCWGSYSPTWEKILDEYTVDNVQKQFEAIFSKITKPQSNI